MVEGTERAAGKGSRAVSHPDAAMLQKKVKDGLAAERRLDDGSVAPWELARLRRLANEGRQAQLALKRGGHEPSLPEESITDD
ncbi:MAG TPA: hypothetical protein ENL12_03300 [Dehalococcoidia bacterium]|nr:hypothetical protein [Dehalococcoidia bacterium]